ncbi:hypothetical protein Tco_0264579 [Tanacetum coccineum]
METHDDGDDSVKDHGSDHLGTEPEVGVNEKSPMFQSPRNGSRVHRDIVNKEDMSTSMSGGLEKSVGPFGKEIKLGHVDDCTICSIWSRPVVNYAYSSLVGASGGILTLWDSRVFFMENTISDRNYLVVFGSWTGVSNKIRHSGERVGSLFDAGEANSFKDFISQNDMFDFLLNGRRFTRFDSGGSKASKLHRFLVSYNFLTKWIDVVVSVLCNKEFSSRVSSS